MLVESVSVKNLKLLGDFAVKGLRPVTLLSGDNGCGKTTLLEAVFMCFHRNWEGGSVPLFNPLRTQAALSDDGYAHLFHKGRVESPIMVSCIGDGLSHTVQVGLIHGESAGENIIPFADAQKANGGAPLEARAVTRILVEHAEQGKLSSRAIVALREDGVQVKKEGAQPVVKFVQLVRDGLLLGGLHEDPDNLSRLQIQGKTGAITKALQIIAPQSTGIAVASVRSKPLVFVRVAGMDKMMPSELLGAGAQKVLSLALALHSREDALFLLDEVTTGWHHSRLTDVWRMIFSVCKERNHQVIATTHSDECITHFVKAAEHEKFEDKCCHVRLDPSYKGDPPGKVNPIYYDYGVLKASRRTGMDVR